MMEELARKQSKNLAFETFKNGHFWQQNVIPDRKSFTTQTKHVIF